MVVSGRGKPGVQPSATGLQFKVDKPTPGAFRINVLRSPSLRSMRPIGHMPLRARVPRLECYANQGLVMLHTKDYA